MSSAPSQNPSTSGTWPSYPNPIRHSPSSSSTSSAAHTTTTSTSSLTQPQHQPQARRHRIHQNNNNNHNSDNDIHNHNHAHSHPHAHTNAHPHGHAHAHHHEIDPNDLPSSSSSYRELIKWLIDHPGLVGWLLFLMEMGTPVWNGFTTAVGSNAFQWLVSRMYGPPLTRVPPQLRQYSINVHHLPPDVHAQLIQQATYKPSTSAPSRQASLLEGYGSRYVPYTVSLDRAPSQSHPFTLY